MNNNNFNDHIMNNTCRAHDRREQGRLNHERNYNQGLENHEMHHENNMCNLCENKCRNEHGGEVYAANISKIAFANQNYRESVWTGKYLQMTLMSIPCGGDIGVEIHCDTDQYIRIEHGTAMVVTGKSEDHLCDKHRLNMGDAIFIPAGVWHNVINIGRRPLKISSVYGPPHHPRCTVEKYRK